MKSTKNKTCKVLPAEPEECGVWLDAAELRGKKQQKMAQPISRLLNPLARSGGYSMAVSLNFTQTKMHIPATKQSTISSFFGPQSKINKDKESSTPLPDAHMRTKRKREMLSELPSETSNLSSHTSQADPQDFSADLEKTVKICDDHVKEQQFFHLIWGYQSEECEPAEKRKCPEDFKRFEHATETQKQGDKAMYYGYRPADEMTNIPETLLHKDQMQQDCFGTNHRTHKENRNDSSARCSADGFYRQELLKAIIVAEKSTSFQTPALTTVNQHTIKRALNSYKGLKLSEPLHQRSPIKRKDKENSRPTSPRQSAELSPLKQKMLSHSSAKLYSGTTPKTLTRQSVENENDSFAMLFTQDSEGFRVIANHSQWSRSPLKDQTNSAKGKDYWDTPNVMSMETENSDQEQEMLFTQDSQGNMVIKH